MPYKISIQDEDIAYIRFYGESDMEENVKARDEVMQVCRDSEIALILADWREGKVAASVSTMNLHEFGSTWPKPHTSKFYCLATVQAVNVDTQRAIEFSDTVGYNRGLFSKIFTDIEDAIDWLKSRKNI